MKAIVRHEYGGTEQVAMEDRTDPVPGPGEVLVEVRAAGVDRGAWHLLHGEPRLMRLAFGRAPAQAAGAGARARRRRGRGRGRGHRAGRG